MKNHCKTQVESWFFWSSLIFDFSVYFNYSSRITFWGKSAFKSGLLFLRKKVFFWRLICFLVFCRTLIPECVHWSLDHFHFVVNNWKNHGKTLVESWFFGTSLIFDLSVHLNHLSRITFGKVGDHFQVLKVSEGTCTFPGGGPLPGPQGVWRYMYGTAYVPSYYTVLRTFGIVRVPPGLGGRPNCNGPPPAL